MSSAAVKTSPPPSGRAILLAVTTVAVVLMTLALSWTSLGAAFYQRVTPYYDSLAYQQSFIHTARESAAQGAWTTLLKEWRGPGITAVLTRLVAAVFGGVVVDANEGLYLYLLPIHLAAMAALFGVIWRISGSLFLGVGALAAWLAAGPFTQAVSGVLDQRMDFASGSFCLLVAALAFGWSRARTIPLAALTGLAAAGAMLHRPVMLVTVTAIVALFAGRSWLRDRGTMRFWAGQAVALAAPVLLLAAPWFVAHREDLYRYYVLANVDVGSASSIREAASYNLGNFFAHGGANYGWFLLVGVIWMAVFRRIDWLDATVVLLATAVPLASLILSRSVGNFIVCQVALGPPALLLACSHARVERRGGQHGLWVVAACGALIWSEVHSLQALHYQVGTAPREKRVQAVQAIAEIMSIEVGPTHRVAGFQAAPLDPFALGVIAAEQGFALETGTRLFHPLDFGVGNAEARTISDEALEAAVSRTLEQLRGRDTLLMLPTADAQLPPVPFSQTKLKVIRAAVEKNPALVRRLTTRPIGGVKFDIYTIAPK